MKLAGNGAFQYRKERFRWLAIHIMDAVSQRLGLRNFGEQFDYRLSNYYPFDDYVAEIGKAETKIIRWQPHAEASTTPSNAGGSAPEKPAASAVD